MNTIFIVFGLTRSGVEPESTVSVADALSTRPLIGVNHELNRLISVFLYKKNQPLHTAAVPIVIPITTSASVVPITAAKIIRLRFARAASSKTQIIQII